MASLSRHFKFVVEGLDETGYPAELAVVVLVPRIKGQGRAAAKRHIFAQHPTLGRWQRVDEIHG